MRFEWEKESNSENVEKRDYNLKVFGDGLERKAIVGSGLMHFYDGILYQDLPNIEFPEGKSVESLADLKAVPIPDWATVEISSLDGGQAVFKDKKNTPIFFFKNPIASPKDAIPFKYKQVNSSNGKTKPTKEELGQLIFEKKLYQLEIDESVAIPCKFSVKDGYLSLELPDGVKAENLNIYDDVDTSTVPSKDVWVASLFPNNNIEEVITYIGYTGNGWERVFTAMTLPSSLGTLTAKNFYSYKLSNRGTTLERTVSIHEITRSDWVENQVTWNRYKTGSNWTTAGGDFGSSIGTTALTTTANDWKVFDCSASAVTWGGLLNLCLKVQTESDTTNSDSSFAARTYTTDTSKRPYLELTYTPSGGSTFIPKIQWLT